MRIVHIITRLIIGGAQENTLITCRLLAERGHNVTLITGPSPGPEGKLLKKPEKQKFDVIIVDKLRRAINPFDDVPAYLEIKKHLQKIKPDIVHTHSAKAGILGRFAGYSLKGRLDNPKIPFVVHTIHGLAFHDYQNRFLNKFYIAIEKAATRKTDSFICVADTMAEKALAAGIGKPEDFITAYSAIEEDDFLNAPSEQQIKDFRRKYNIPDKTIVLVTIARLFELKGHKYIIESAKKLSRRFGNCMWLFVGDGKLSSQIKRQIQISDLGYKFKFTGLVAPGEIPLAIHSSDILVHCSLREGLARVLPQAMLCGKPAISFDIDGAKEVVNNDTGRLIEPKNIEQLTGACAELISDAELREWLGKNGREFVRRKFAPDTMVNTIESVYNKLVQY